MIFFAESDKVEMPDRIGHAVGDQRWELLARLAGNEVRTCKSYITNVIYYCL